MNIIQEELNLGDPVVSDITQEGTLPPASRSNDQETSIEAAEDASRFAKGNRLLALRTLAREGAMTDFELAEITGLQQNSIGKRRSELFSRRLVEKAIDSEGDVLKRPAPSGSNAIVWKITEKGRQVLKEVEA